MVEVPNTRLLRATLTSIVFAVVSAETEERTITPPSVVKTANVGPTFALA